MLGLISGSLFNILLMNETRLSEAYPQAGKYTGSLILINNNLRFSSSHFDSLLKKALFQTVINR